MTAHAFEQQILVARRAFVDRFRLGDIDADNRVRSTQVADARVTYTGNGAVGRASREGWLSKFFNMISPF